jgi:hypothetical protein
MRRGIHGVGISYLDDGRLLGMNLGADFTAEHEFGIKNIIRDYAIDNRYDGIDKRIIRRAPLNQILVGKLSNKFSKIKEGISKPRWGLISFMGNYTKSMYPKITERLINDYELNPNYHGDSGLTGSWDSQSFGIVMNNEDHINSIYDAIKSKDICIGLFDSSPKNPFSNSGLGIIIASRIPKQLADSWLKSDLNERALIKASEKTRIKKKLEKADLKFYALTPGWLTELCNKRDSKYNVVYWLNPVDQHKHNCGWFTVEELLEWTKDKGPVIKSENKRK